MKKLVLFFALLCTPVVFGQSPTPPDTDAAIAATVNFTGKLTEGITDLVTNVAPSMMTVGWVMLGLFGVYALVQTLLQHNLRSLSMHYYVPLAQVVAYVSILFRIVCAVLMMTTYMNAIPGIGLNFHQLFPAAGNALSKAVTADLLKDVITAANTAMHNTPTPGLLQVFPALISLSVLFNIALLEVGATVVTAGGLVIVGMLTLVGPLMIPFYVLPGWDKKFWTWIENMVAYSMYGFVGSAFVFVFMHVYIDFFTNLHGWSAGQWFLSLPYLILITAAFLWTMNKVPQIAHMIFGGVGGIAQGFMGALQGLAVRAVAAALM
jgi:hypothetical protein